MHDKISVALINNFLNYSREENANVRILFLFVYARGSQPFSGWAPPKLVHCSRNEPGAGGVARNSNTPRTYGRRGVRAIVTTADVRPTGGGGVRAIVTQPRTYDRRGGGGGVRAIVTTADVRPTVLPSPGLLPCRAYFKN